MERNKLEEIIRQVLLEHLGGGVQSVKVPALTVTESHRMNTGNPGDQVYTRDLFTLEQSPRLGVGIMEMRDTTFPWTLNYDEMDYVVEGRLEILCNGQKVSAGPGELIYIPKGSGIQFSVTGHARFLYFVYPADWQNQQ